MPRAIAIPVREKIYEQWKQGYTTTGIAQVLNLSERTVAHLIKRFREKGEEGIATSYAKRGNPMSISTKEVCQVALALKEEHPTWGSDLIRVMLLERFEEDRVPTSRTLRRWFAENGISASPPKAPKRESKERATRPHETWQLDASEDIVLGNEQPVSWLRVVDEHTGAVLKTRVFSRGTLQSSECI